LRPFEEAEDIANHQEVNGRDENPNIPAFHFPRLPFQFI
jgi:hypothetical protein